MSEKFEINLKVDNVRLYGAFEINNNMIVIIGDNLAYKSTVMDLIWMLYKARNDVAIEAKGLSNSARVLTSKWPHIPLDLDGRLREGTLAYDSFDISLTFHFKKAKVRGFQLHKKMEKLSQYKIEHLFASVSDTRIKRKLHSNEQEIYRDLKPYDIIFVENVDSVVTPNNAVKFIRILYDLSKQGKKVFIETICVLTLETLNTLIAQDNGKVTVLQTERNGNNVSITCYEANKDNLIDASIYAETYLDVLREGFAYE